MFRPDTIQAAEIRKEANYAGVRVTLLGLIDGARCPIQVDIGFGDAVTPGPEEVRYPVMLQDFEAPKLRVYPRYTVVALRDFLLPLTRMTPRRLSADSADDGAATMPAGRVAGVRSATTPARVSNSRDSSVHRHGQRREGAAGREDRRCRVRQATAPITAPAIP
jgi:hypothetical protein